MSMTENNYDKLKDAICELVNLAEDATSREVFEMLDNAGADVIDCLDKLSGYEAIGTIEDFKALKEKNEPKKIRRIYGTWSGDNYFKSPNNAIVYQCIECYSTVRVGENYCCNCGSCIDWSE